MYRLEGVGETQGSWDDFYVKCSCKLVPHLEGVGLKEVSRIDSPLSTSHTEGKESLRPGPGTEDSRPEVWEDGVEVRDLEWFRDPRSLLPGPVLFPRKVRGSRDRVG